MAKHATCGGAVLLVTFLALVNLEFLLLHHNVEESRQVLDHTLKLPSKLTHGTQEQQNIQGYKSAPNNLADSGSSADSQDRDRDSAVQIGTVEFPPELPSLDEAFKSFTDYEDMRVAVLVPFSGPGLPVWFDAFAELAAANSELVDWKIFCEEVSHFA